MTITDPNILKLITFKHSVGKLLKGQPIVEFIMTEIERNYTNVLTYFFWL